MSIENQKCSFCGEPAVKFSKTTGNYSCMPSSNSCPANLEKNSKGLLNAYISGIRKPATIIYKNLSEETKKRMNSNKGKNFLKNEDIFIINSKTKREVIKEYIHRNKLIPYECECGINGIWRNKKITLELDHINGIFDDNRIENLRFMCPNCHSQTDTFRGKNQNKIAVTDEQLINALNEEETIYAACIKLRIAGTKSQYQRALKLIEQYKIIVGSKMVRASGFEPPL